MTNPRSKGNGATIKWLRERVNHQGDACLIWPFNRIKNGYALFTYNGEQFYAHRYMCTLVHGEPPAVPPHAAAHSCGKGHEGCCNPRHLSWKTYAENSADMLIHGTAGAKRGKPRRTLTREQVDEIRRIGRSVTQEELGRRFGVTDMAIRHVLNGSTWKDRPTRFGRQFTAEERARLIERASAMRARFATYQQIADELEISRNSARVFAHEFEQR